MDLLVFKSTNMTGIGELRTQAINVVQHSDTTILQAPHFLELTVKYKIAHVIIPTISYTKNVWNHRRPFIDQFMQIYNFSIIQIEDVFPENLIHVCLNMHPERTIPALSLFHVFHLCEWYRLNTRFKDDEKTQPALRKKRIRRYRSSLAFKASFVIYGRDLSIVRITCIVETHWTNRPLRFTIVCSFLI